MRLSEGGVIRDGYSSGLGRTAGTLASHGRGWISGLETEERKRTGIGSLKVGFYVSVWVLFGSVQIQFGQGSSRLDPQTDLGERRTVYHTGIEKFKKKRFWGRKKRPGPWNGNCWPSAGQGACPTGGTLWRWRRRVGGIRRVGGLGGSGRTGPLGSAGDYRGRRRFSLSSPAIPWWNGCWNPAPGGRLCPTISPWRDKSRGSCW
jgi:hypothetical protein